MEVKDSGNVLDLQPVETDKSAAVTVHVRDGRVVVDSRDVARVFGKQHKDILKAIRELETPNDFKGRNFAPFKIKDLTGESTSSI